MFFNVFWNAAYATKWPKNAPKIHPKAPKIDPKTPKMQPRWPLGAHMGAKTPPKTAQKHPKRSCFSPFLGFWCQMLPSAPQDARDSEIWSKKSPQDPPDLLWTWISIQFWTISYEISKDFSSCFASLCSPLLCFALLYWINNQSPALSRQCFHTPTTSSKQCFFTGTVAGDAKHLG